VATFTAFYDAYVLYPVELRNLLMHLALTWLFRAKWVGGCPRSLKNPPRMAIKHLAILERQGLTQTGTALREFLHQI
jgi:hypothetical protein